jgi:hypothetical protein
MRGAARPADVAQVVVHERVAQRRAGQQRLEEGLVGEGGAAKEAGQLRPRPHGVEHVAALGPAQQPELGAAVGTQAAGEAPPDRQRDEAPPAGAQVEALDPLETAARAPFGDGQRAVADEGRIGLSRGRAGDLLGRLDRIVLACQEDRLGRVGAASLQLAEAVERGGGDAPAPPADTPPGHETHVLAAGELVHEPPERRSARAPVEMDEEGAARCVESTHEPRDLLRQPVGEHEVGGAHLPYLPRTGSAES